MPGPSRGERERAHLGLGHHPGAVLERVVGQRPAGRRARRPHPGAPVARARGIEHDEHVGLGERRPRELLGRAVHDALIVLAEALGHREHPSAAGQAPAYQAGGAAGAVRIATFGWRRAAASAACGSRPWPLMTSASSHATPRRAKATATDDGAGRTSGARPTAGAFARLGLAWDDALVISGHGRDPHAALA